MGELLAQIQKYKTDLETLQLKFESTLNKEHETNGDVDEADNGLKEKYDQLKADNATLQTNLDKMKEKNNDLREKNWKAMDEVAKAEKVGKQMVEDLKISIFKGLKQVHPDLAIPKGESIEEIFATYAHNQKAQEDAEQAELAALREENEKLTATVEEMKNAPVEVVTAPPPPSSESSSEELETAQMEAEHYKKVLNETEALLSKRQEGVDSEISNKTQALEAKEEELK